MPEWQPLKREADARVTPPEILERSYRAIRNMTQLSAMADPAKRTKQ